MENASQPKKSGFLGNYDAHLFWPVTIIYLGIIAFAVIDPTAAGVTFSAIQRFVLSNFSWLILLTGASAICFALWMACSQPLRHRQARGQGRQARILLLRVGSHALLRGPRHGFRHFRGRRTALPPLHRPHHHRRRTYRKISGRARSHPPCRGQLGPFRLAHLRRRRLGRHNKPLRTSTGLYGLLGERCNDTFFSKAVDVLAAIGTIGGVSMMIGLGVASISYAFLILFGIELNAVGKFTVMLCLILTYIISSATGLARGMRLLSESNGYLTLGLLAAVLFLGATPFTYVANMLLQVTSEFLFRLPQNLLWTDAGNFEPREWSGTWFIFYILWNVSYLPFTGGFIARISRGRTMREYICGTVLVPLFMTLLWFSIWGSNACFEQLNGYLPLYEAAQNNPEQALYILLGSFPFGTVLCFVAFVCFCLFAITTADAASHFIAQQTTQGTTSSSLPMRVFWGCLIGFTGILFQVTGGFTAIKSLAIAAASPFVLVTFAYIISIVKMMKQDEHRE